MYNLKKLSQALSLLLVTVLMSGSVAFASPTSPGGTSPTTPGALCLMDSDTWGLCESTFTFGDATNPIADGEFTALTVGTLTSGGLVLTGDIDMAGYNIDNVDKIYGDSAPVQIGDVAGTSHTLTSEDDLLVTGKLEVDGFTYHDSTVFLSQLSGLYIGESNSYPGFASYNSQLNMVGVNAVDTVVLGAHSYVNKNFDHGAQTTPTFYIHSDENPDTDNTEWVSFTHDGTEARIESGKGSVVTGGIFEASAILATSYIKTTQTAGAALQINDNDLRVNTTADYYQQGLDVSLGRQINFVDQANVAIDHNHNALAYPVVYINSQTSPASATDEWISFGHNVTNGVIDVGSGVISMADPVTVTGALTVNTGQIVINGGAGGIGLVQQGTSMWITPTAGSNSFPSKFRSVNTSGFQLLLDGTNARTNHSFVIASGDAATTAYTHTLETDPKLFIHSATASGTATDQWIGLTHDQTNAVITAGTGDVKVDDSLEVTGNALIDGYVYLGDGSNGLNNGVDDGLRMFVRNLDGNTNNNFILTEYLNRNLDHDHETLSANPTFFIHSSTSPDTDNTQWLSLTHDVTNTVLTSGDGAIQLVPDSTFGIDVQTTGAKVACGSTTRGQLFLEEGAAEATDTLYMCMKAAADTYSWISITTGG